jgi:hypothetical protein
MPEYNDLTNEEKVEFDEATEKRNEAYYSFCDKIITLSTGFLALTITFKNSFVSSDPSLPFLLFLSWICFTVAILTSTYIHWGKAWIYKQRTIEILNQQPGTGMLPHRFTITRYIMFFSFSVAIICLAIFAIINNI